MVGLTANQVFRNQAIAFQSLPSLRITQGPISLSKLHFTDFPALLFNFNIATFHKIIVQRACDSQSQTKTNGECMSQPCGLYAPGMS